MTIPNLITTVRIILVPVFVIYLLDDQFFSAFLIFVICAASDGLDGMFARLFKQKSKLGAYLDPLADKILIVAAFVVLAIREVLPAWLTVIVIARDVLIQLGIFIVFLNNVEIKIKPSMISKVNTCFQFLTVTVVLLKPTLALSELYYSLIFYTTALFTISSFFHYTHFWYKMLGDKLNNGNGE